MNIDGLVWFEELVAPAGYMPYILNGHIYSILALYMLADATEDSDFILAARQGVQSLNELLPLFDTGYWTKYDLRPSVFPYIEAHFSEGTHVNRIDVSNGTDNYSLCADGCTATLSSALSNNAYIFYAFMPSLREYHAGQIRIKLSVEADGPVSFYTITRKPTLERVPIADNEINIQDTGYGQTAYSYQKWHILLMEELAKWTNLPVHEDTASRWRAYMVNSSYK